MSSISLEYEWLTAGGDPAALRETVAQFTLRVDDVSLTQNEDVWSKTVRDGVLVSLYPLAAWLAASWWRLSYEPLPQHGSPPSTDWRMAHEIGAANSGYVWPQILLASDGEAVQFWAVPSSSGSRQSVRYLTGLATPRAVALQDFQNSIDGFMAGVLGRLRAVGQLDTGLESLWSLVMQDRADTEQARIRRIEAQMGFDPEECPDSVMAQAIELEHRTGSTALSELAPIYGRREEGSALAEIPKLAASDGLKGKPRDIRRHSKATHAAAPPWQRGVEAARELRREIGESVQPIHDTQLYGLLGLSAKSVSDWSPVSRHQAGIGVPDSQGYVKFVSRKRHPIGKRFEFARFLGDYLRSDSPEPTGWLTSTDLGTSRQKFQRAFAAEFLCPISSAVGFLGGDFSEPAIEEAASHFGVSDQTVESLLANNGYISHRYHESWFPYRVTA